MGNPSHRSRPFGLQCITWLLILTGIWTWILFLMSLGQGRLHVHTNLLTLVLGIGLLMLKSWARVLTIIFAAMTAAISVFAALDAAFDFRIAYLNWGGRRQYVSEMPGISLTLCAIAVALSAWTIHRLLRGDVTHLFNSRTDKECLCDRCGGRTDSSSSEGGADRTPERESAAN